MKNRDGTLFTSAIKYNANDESRLFGESDGFQLAIAIYDIINQPGQKNKWNRDIEEYLKIKVKYLEKDFNNLDEQFISSELKIQKCSKE